MKDSPNFSEFSPSVMRKQINQIYEFGEFRLETAERLLLTSQGPKPLRPKEFDTLLVLVQQSGHLIEKEELIRRVWPDTAVEEANLARNIYSLRKALGDDNHAHKYIETVPTRGYRSAIPSGAEIARVVTRPPDADRIVCSDPPDWGDRFRDLSEVPQTSRWRCSPFYSRATAATHKQFCRR